MSLDCVASVVPTGAPKKRAVRIGMPPKRRPQQPEPEQGFEVPELETYEELITELEEETRAKGETIANLQADAAQKDARIKGLEAELAKKDRQLADVSRRLDRLATFHDRLAAKYESESPEPPLESLESMLRRAEIAERQRGQTQSRR